MGSNPPLEDDTVDLWQVVLNLWDARRLIVLGTVTAALVASAISFALPKTYEATATVFVTPLTFQSALKTPAFSVEAYGRLAESDYMRDLVRDELRRLKVIDATQQVGKVSIVLYPSREPQKPYLPLFGLVARWHTPEGAQAIANAWATTFVAEQAKLAAASTAGTVNFVVTEFPKASRALADAELDMKALQTRHGAELGALRASSAVEIKSARLSGQEQWVIELEGRLDNTRLDIIELKERIAQLQAELARTPQFVVLSKAITDDALWQRVGSQSSTSAALPEDVVRQRLETQELNFVYDSLSRQLAEARVGFNSLVPLESELVKQIAAARTAASQARTELMAAGLKIADLDREQQLERSFQQRKIDEANARFGPISARIGEAEIAKSQSQPDLEVGALAARPLGPIRPNIRVNVAAAALAGFLLSLIGAWIARHARPKTVPAPPKLAPLV